MDKNKIIDKIRKCLQLANSSNPNEAATALRQAQKLMEKHGVSSGDVQLADISSEATALSRARKQSLHLVMLVQLIEKAFGVRSLVDSMKYGFGPWRSNVVFIGFDAQPKIATYAFEVLRKRLAADRKRFLLEQSTKRHNRIRKIRLADSYAEGWVMAVRRTGQEFAVPPEKKELINQWVENTYKSEVGEADEPRY